MRIIACNSYHFVQNQMIQLRRILVGIPGAKFQLCPLNYSNHVEPVQLSFNVFESNSTNKSSPPVIIMHGLFGSKQNWRGISRALADKVNRKIYSVDARNHGDSPHSPNHSSSYMTEDIKELMRSEGIPKASIIGHSMGGRAMMHFALQYPDLVERTIIVDISPLSVPKNFDYMEQIFIAMKNTSVPSNVSMAEGRVIAERQIKEAIGDKETVDFIMLNLRKLESGEFVWRPNVSSLHENFKHFRSFMRDIDHLNSHDGPVLFICGNQSAYVDPDQWPDIQKIFPNSEIQWLDAGHLVHFDQPKKFIDLVVQFLNK